MTSLEVFSRYQKNVEMFNVNFPFHLDTVVFYLGS